MLNQVHLSYDVTYISEVNSPALWYTVVDYYKGADTSIIIYDTEAAVVLFIQGLSILYISYILV